MVNMKKALLWLIPVLVLLAVILPASTHSSEIPGTEPVLNVQSTFCPNEYCEPDPKFKDFFRWLRSVGYQECFIGRYAKDVDNSTAGAIIKKFLDKRPMGFVEPVVVHFYDVIPTDTEATYKSLGLGEGGNCQFAPTLPTFCPSPRPADYAFVEEKFEQTFGLDFQFVYHRTPIDYSETFGDPIYNTSGLYKDTYTFPNRSNFIQQFPNRSIIHYATQSWNGKNLTDMTGGGRVEEIDYEPFNPLGMVTYTHEWGHTLVWPHTFYNDPQTGRRIFIGLDGIMSNTYIAGSTLEDPLDTFERYAIEPANGLQRSKDYAQHYNTMVGKPPMSVCGTINPAIAEVRMISNSPEKALFRLKLVNSGTADTGFVDLAVFDLANPTSPIIQRTVAYLPVAPEVFHFLTVPHSLQTSRSLSFVLDKDDLIEESAESDNRVDFIVDENINHSPELTVPVSLEGLEGTRVHFEAEVLDLDADIVSTIVENLPPSATFTDLEFDWVLPAVDQTSVYPLIVAASDGKETTRKTVQISTLNYEPRLIHAASRRLVNSVGTFNINLPLERAQSGIEPRLSRDGDGIVLKFDQAVMPGSLRVVSQGPGTAVPLVFEPEEREVQLGISGFSNESCTAISLFNQQTGSPLVGDNDVHIRSLVGDVNLDGVVNIVDLNQVKIALGQTINLTNFVYDIDRNGTIDNADIDVVKQNLFKRVSIESCPDLNVQSSVVGASQPAAAVLGFFANVIEVIAGWLR